MLYDEPTQQPINDQQVVRRFGVNPNTAPINQLGVYSLKEAPEGYSTVAYIKEGEGYTAVPHEFSDEERKNIYRIQEYGLKLEEAAEKLKGEAPVTQEEKPKRRRKKAD